MPSIETLESVIDAYTAQTGGPDKFNAEMLQRLCDQHPTHREGLLRYAVVQLTSKPATPDEIAECEDAAPMPSPADALGHQAERLTGDARKGLDGWVAVSDRLPRPGVNVLFGYRNQYGKWRTLRGHHSPLHTVDASAWEDGADDAEDGSFEPEGWWEEPVESETLNYVSDAVSHWMPLPAPPGAGTGGNAHALSGRFRKKPVVIEAIQWNGANRQDVADFCGDDVLTPIEDYRPFQVGTLEGQHNASVNDWIIRGVKGEHYPCKPDIFAATYEPVTADTGGQSDDAKDAARYRWLGTRLFGADFAYGEPDPICAIVFEWPKDASISADLGASIDAAMAKERT